MKTAVIKINPQEPEAQKIAQCAKILRGGGLVAFPTETVYGLGANLLNKKAIHRLYAVKKRAQGKPFSVHIADKDKAEEYAMNLTPTAYKLMDKFWPGPLTLILPSREGGSIGIRMPKNTIALNLIQESGVPIVAPSANLSGNPAPRNVNEVLKDLNGLIDAVIDGGVSELGIESTIVDLTASPVEFLREAAIKKQDIEKVIKTKTILFVCTGNSCRSVMAEALLKKMLAGRTDIEVISAGTNASVGMPPTAETKDVLLKEGIDVSSHSAQKVSEAMLKRADFILVMEKLHEEYILSKLPTVKNRLYLLKEFAKISGNDLNIYDPIGKPEEVYRDCFNEIKNALSRIAEII